MHLTDADKRMLDGGDGRLVREAMRFLVRLGEAFDAEDLIDLDYAYVYIDCMDSWGKGNLTENLLEEASAEGVRCRIPTTTWVSGRELDEGLYAVLGIGPKERAELAKESEIGKRLGMVHIDTCAPYLVSDLARPAYGAHIASIESSAVTYFNTAMGVRTNRDGISAFFAALTGRYPDFGMHRDAARRGRLVVDVRAPLQTSADYSALGFWVGQRAGLEVPVLSGPAGVTTEQMQCLCAALAVGGAVSMAHIVGVTPEAPTEAAALGGRPPAARLEFTDADLAAVYEQFNSPADKVDFVCLGCPHASIHDLKRYADRFAGRKVAPGVTVWLHTAATNFFLARCGGELETLERAGVHVLVTCPMVNPGVPGPAHTFHDRSYSIGNFATNSMKLLYYAHNCLRPAKTFFGSTEACIGAALTGRWRGPEGPGRQHAPQVSPPDVRGAAPGRWRDPLVLEGKVVVAGTAEAEALVAHDPVSFLGMVNTETGAFDYPGHELQGRSIAGKVLVYPFGKGSSGDTIRMWRTDRFGVAPAAILFSQAEPIHVQGAMLLGVPTLYLNRPLPEALRTGDRVRIDGARVTITPGPPAAPAPRRRRGCGG